MTASHSPRVAVRTPCRPDTARHGNAAGPARRDCRFDHRAAPRARARRPPRHAGSGPQRRCAVQARRNVRRARDRERGGFESIAGAGLGTARNGRSVVASATRSRRPPSIMTTCSVPVSSARNSVCPVKGTPAVVDDALVHRGGDDGVKLATLASARSLGEGREDIAGIGRVELPRRRGGGPRNGPHADTAGLLRGCLSGCPGLDKDV